MAKVTAWRSYGYVTLYDFSLSRLELKTLLVGLMKSEATSKKPVSQAAFRT